MPPKKREVSEALKKARVKTQFSGARAVEMNRRSKVARSRNVAQAKSFHKLAEQIASLPATEEMLEMLKQNGVSEEDANFQMALAMQTFFHAMNGNPKALEKFSEWFENSKGESENGKVTVIIDV